MSPQPRCGWCNGVEKSRHGRFEILAASLIVAGALCSFLDGPMSAAAYMRKHAAIGRWVLRHAGPAPAIAGTLNHLTLDTYYSNGHVVGSYPLADCLLVPMRAAIAQRNADVVVLWNEENVPREYFAMIAERVTYCGYRRVNANELPVGENEVMVFVRGQ